MEKKQKNLKFQDHTFVIITAIFFLIISTGQAFAKVNIDEIKTIGLEKNYEIPMPEVQAGDVLSVDIQVTTGGPVDVLLMKSSDYQGYLNAVKVRGTFNYMEDASLKAITSQKYSYKFMESGDYSLIIDNTDVPKAGGSPLDQVEINLKVSVVTPAATPKTAGFEAIPAIFVLIVMAIRRK